MKQKTIIVISDIEMGAGNLTDDFISDKALSEVINSLSRRTEPVDLVLNGDTFNLLMCPVLKKGELVFPRYFKEENTLEKLKLIVGAHGKVFEALKYFLKNKNNKIFFIIGNHDHELFFPRLETELKTLLGHGDRIFFPGLSYQDHDVYIEHGQQYDALHHIDPGDVFQEYRGEKLLKLPVFSAMVINVLMDGKHEYPFFERISPRPLKQYPHLLRYALWLTFSYYLKSLLYYPLRYYGDPTYVSPKGVLKDLIRRIRDEKGEISEIWNVGAISGAYISNRKKVKNPWPKLSVLGHSHEKIIKDHEHHPVAHPGTWRDEYTLNQKNGVLTPISKGFLEISIENDRPARYQIIDCPPERSRWLLEDVKKDEIGYIRRAAAEEGFTIKF